MFSLAHPCFNNNNKILCQLAILGGCLYVVCCLGDVIVVPDFFCTTLSPDTQLYLIEPLNVLASGCMRCHACEWIAGSVY
jgi:hypothetical protein